MSPGGYAAIILAAGFSSRMEEFKPLLTIGGITITDRIISSFLSNGVDVLLVTGWRRNELINGIQHRDIQIIYNPDYESGMLSSVQAGVRRLLPDHRSFFIMPVDIPLVRTTTIKHLIDNAEINPGRIIYPVFDSVRGHPPLIPSFLIPEITDWQREGGLDTILGLHRKLDLEVSVADENILLDIDYREDYEKLLERFRHYDIPTEKECKAMLDIVETPEHIRRHCHKVAQVAVAIGEALSGAGREVDIGAVYAAAVLHDIAKGQKQHGAAGGKILSDSGFSRIGEIIAMHQELTDDFTEISIEAKIVYLADKYVYGDKLVSIAERYRISEEKYGNIPEAVQNIKRRKGRTIRVKKELEIILGHPLDDIIS